MTLTKEGYRPRIIDTLISSHLKAFGAVLIEGPKFCGKTWASLNHAQSAYFVDDPTNNYANRTRAKLDPTSVLVGDEPRLLDEWQEAPGIWDAIRFNVDQGHARGRYLLSGSSSVSEVETAHSGTGRIARLSMRPMTLFESGDSSGAVSLKDLIEQQPVVCEPSKLSLDGLIRLVIRGGWPETLDMPFEAARLLPKQYNLSLANRDISRLDGVKRDPAKTLALLASVARNTAQIVSNTTIEKDIQSHSDGERLSQQSVATYLAKLKALFVIDEIKGWAPALRSPVRLRSTPKHYLVDPSLAVAGIDASVESLLADTKTLGFLFENLVVRDLLVYASTLNANLFYYLDDSQLDIDIIIGLGGERWGAIEVKLGSEQEDEAAAKLSHLARKLTERGIRPPLFSTVITGIGSTSHQRDDGIYVVPIDCLKP